MEKALKGSCIIGQSGGPTSVINASAYGVIRTALDNENITRVFGAAHGIKGVLEDKLYDMGEEDAKELELLMNTPSSELGSCRYKMATLTISASSISSRSTMYATSSITAAMIPWTPATKSAAIWPGPAGSAALWAYPRP